MIQTQQARQALSPKTYLERGTAVPFTAPLLAGARLRDGISGARLRDGSDTAIEVVLPNPSGKRGLYVLPWRGAVEFCRPTMHDCVLYERLAATDPLTPTTVRRVASAVAAEGYAGEAAQMAAESAAHERAVRLAENAFLLTLALIDQVLPVGGRLFPDAPKTPDIGQRGKQAVLHFADVNRCTPGAVLQVIKAQADQAEPLGLVETDAAAWAPQLIVRLAGMRASMLLWRRDCPEPTSAALAEALAEAAGMAAQHGAAVLATARAIVLNVEPTLRLGMAEPDGMAALLSRPLWVLDGWDRICLLWEVACERRYQRAAMLEISQILPQPPSELSRWLSTPLAAGALEPACQVTSINDAWRTGSAAFALIARNEQLRARAA